MLLLRSSVVACELGEYCLLQRIYMYKCPTYMSYVATDSYRPGTPTWLQYSPNSQATTELRKSSITIINIYIGSWVKGHGASRCIVGFVSKWHVNVNRVRGEEAISLSTVVLSI